MNMSRLEVLSELGFKRDPFPLVHMETADSIRIRRLISMAVTAKRTLSIVAESGTGKTSAINLALSEMPVHVIRPQSCDRERITVGDIERALIYDLGHGEVVKRTREVRARQLRRVMGEASRDKKIVLVLEEAHRMHPQTLRSLKSMLDIEFAGIAPLFTVIMVSQYDPMRSSNVTEIKRRSDTIQMKGLSSPEVKQYLASTIGSCFDEDAIEAVTSLSYSNNFLDLQTGLIGFMIRALSDGRKRVEALDIYEGTGGNLSALLKKLGISYGELEKETGIPKSTLNLVATDKRGTLTTSKVMEVRSRIMDVVKKHSQPNNIVDKAEEGEGPSLEVVGGDK